MSAQGLLKATLIRGSCFGLLGIVGIGLEHFGHADNIAALSHIVKGNYAP